MRFEHAVQIFLSYRRGDVGGYAGRLTDALVQRLGAKNVFHDVTAIAPGQDFDEAINRALDDCDAVLAVIGPSWSAAVTSQGAPRLFEADDYVRLELATALKRKVRVVPVLVGGASMPAAADLPDDLRELVQRQAVVLHDETWHQNVDAMVRSLRGEPAVSHRRNRRWPVIGAVAGVLALAGAGAWWWGPGTGDDGGSDAADPGPCAPPTGPEWSRITLGKNPVKTVQTPTGPTIYRVKDAHSRAHAGKWQVTLAMTMENATSDSRYDGDWLYESLVVGQRQFGVTCFSPDPELVDSGLVGDAMVGFEVRCKPVGYIALVVEDTRLSVTDDTLEPGTC
ncbi:MAG TPA: toll/interleukin-1 receptor domain-containing protein [Streptosporangiaceae bacterium]|nr:toll/interleukin-1 receptor domain-containing protein [Streptosporangiaceae bacterium]